MVSQIQFRATQSQPDGLSAMRATAVAQASGEANAPASRVTPVPKADIKVNTEQMKKNLQETVARLSDMLRDGGRGLNITMDEKLGHPVVYVKNSDTGEVVRQIPNEVLVNVAHSIEDLKGLLLNKKS